MKKLFLLTLVCLLVSATFQAQAEWIPLSKNGKSNEKPTVTILNEGENFATLKIDISGFELNQFLMDGTLMHHADLLTDVFTTNAGAPELPYVTAILALPFNADAVVEVLETEQVQIFKNINLNPARPSWVEGEKEPDFIANYDGFKANEVFPSAITKSDPPVVFRDLRIARFSFFPLTYIPAKKELHAVSSITIKINYDYSKTTNPRSAPKKPIPPSFGQFYRSFVLNYDYILQKEFDGKENGHDVMLCIMPDNMYNAFQAYAKWKKQSGIDIKAVKFSTIGATASNPITIRNYIADAYHNWEYPPTYVLAVGDDGYFPIKIVNYSYSFPNEDYFVEIDGNDHFPEMMIGRLPVQTEYRLEAINNKCTKYEKHPYMADSTWFTKGICCSNDAYLSQIEIKRFTANVMKIDGKFSLVDTFMSKPGCPYTMTHVFNSINNGRSFLNYRGEGWTTGWWATCYPIKVSDLTAVNNGEKLVFITSIGCGVAMFNGGNCFGEEWLKMGTTTSFKGAVAFVGPVSNTHTTYNNKIDKGIYVGMFREGMETPGQGLLRGKLYLYNVYGTDPMVEYHYRVFTILGDPSLHIWKKKPNNVTVTHPNTIPLGYYQFPVTVTHVGLHNSNTRAQVCISNDSIFATYYTDSLGTALIEVTTTTTDSITLTVRGEEIIPYQKKIAVSQSSEYVAPTGQPIITDIDGNMNGLLNPGEHCNITFTLKNTSNNTANNVMAEIVALDTNVIRVITAGGVSFGDLQPNQTLTGNPYQFYIKPNAQIGSNFTLKLHVTTTNFSWNYNYEREIMGCNLNIKDYYVNDNGNSMVNYRMDPGETVKLYFSISNMGTDVASDVKGIISTSNPYITILDSVGSFGNLTINSAASNIADYFRIQIHPNCPVSYPVQYNLKLYNETGYPYSKNTSSIIPVSMPVSSDFTGPDAYGYYGYASTDPHFDQAPVYNWFELSGIGTRMQVTSGTNGNYTKTVNLPFTFKYYGVDYTKLRISTDGWIALDSGTQTAPINYSLPHNDNVNCMIAPFWDDLYKPTGETGKIFYYHDAPNHRFIIEWDSILHNNSAIPEEELFQVILHDPLHYPTPTGDGEIIFQYKEIADGNSNTVGIENHTQYIGLQYVFNNNYDSTASLMTGPLALKFTTVPPSMFVGINNYKPTFNNNGRYLEQNIPNPFSKTTKIFYTNINSENITISIYDIKGQLVKTLFSGHQLQSRYSLEWSGTNDAGQIMPSGVYFCKLHTQTHTEMKKIVFIK